jgi:pimeloyl-ACP methyl ester carboxylesterase
MGHSWGTFLGIQAAARAPEFYHAYIGMSQISQQLESEKLAYEYMLEQYKAAGKRLNSLLTRTGNFLRIMREDVLVEKPTLPTQNK